MRSARRVRVGGGVGLALCGLLLASPLRAQGWVAALSELRAGPSGVGDSALPLSERIVAARALGEFGPEGEATPVLLAALSAKPPPALRDEILFALARRAPPAAEANLRALLAQDGLVSPALVSALAAIGSPSALSALVAALGRDQPAVIEQALLRAGRPAGRPLIAALGGQLAVRSARMLGRLGAQVGDIAEPALLRALAAPAPALRAAAAIALGEIGRVSSAPALLARVRDPDPRAAQAALSALARVASPSQAGALADLYRSAPIAQRSLALRALVRADPSRVRAALARAIAAGDDRQRVVARELLESAAAPDLSWVPLLAKALASDLSEATASALARVPEGGGMRALLAIAERTPDAAQRCARALALGLRRFGDALDDDTQQRARAVLHSLPPGERRLLLCALARDPAALHFAIAGLAAADPSRRAAAAQAAAWLGDVRAGASLARALARERDVEALRRMSDAALELDVDLPLRVAWRALRDAETAPELMQLVTTRAQGVPAESLRVFLRRALSSSPVARVRAAAALALARIDDRQALTPLHAALGDPSPGVRLAVVRALAAIGGDRAARELRVHARLERDAHIAALARAEAARGGRPAPLTPRGALALEVQLHARGSAAPRPIVDILLRDGRWLRMRALAGSELIVTDLREGLADVRALD